MIRWGKRPMTLPLTLADVRSGMRKAIGDEVDRVLGVIVNPHDTFTMTVDINDAPNNQTYSQTVTHIVHPGETTTDIADEIYAKWLLTQLFIIDEELDLSDV